MKVICIDDKRQLTPDTPKVKVGDTYTVIKTYNITNKPEYMPGLYYALQEMPESAYHESLFAPLSCIDETTFERNYNKQPA